MIIKIQYFPDAEDDMDADAQEPKYTAYCADEDEVDAFMGMIERNKEVLLPEDAVEESYD